MSHSSQRGYTFIELVVVSTIVVATPAILQGASDIMVQERLPLWLVGLAATLSMIERLPDADTRQAGLFDYRSRGQFV